MDEPSKPRDPLEAELACFRPQSISHGLYSRIEASLVEPRRRRWPRSAFVGLAAAAAAAACVAIAIGLAWSNRSNTNTNVITANPAPSARTIRAASPPSVMDYQQAFAESSDAFDALLAGSAGSEDAPVRAFSFPGTDSINNTGDQK